MSLRFYPLFQEEEQSRFIDQDKRQCLTKQQQEETLIISLIDLKPQQLPISDREFITDQMIEEQTKLKGQKMSKEGEQMRIYSNIESMLWISQPIELMNMHWLNEEQIVKANELKESSKCKIYVRYVYLPPLSQFMREYSQRMRRQTSEIKSNSLSLTNSTHTKPVNSSFSNSSNQLPHQTQLIMEQRHQVMYCLARELSSAAVYDFGSKYIRFDHLGFQDYKQSVFKRFNNRGNSNDKKFSKWITYNKREIRQDEDIPYYVVIKSSTYSSERDYQVYKVKLSNNSQSSCASSRQQGNSSAMNISMEIDSRSVMCIKKTISKQLNQLQWKELIEMSDKLLELKEKGLTNEIKEKRLTNEIKEKGLKNETKTIDNKLMDNNTETLIPVETQLINGYKSSQVINDDKLEEKDVTKLKQVNDKILIKQSLVKWIKPIQYNFFINLLISYTHNSQRFNSCLFDGLSHLELNKNNKESSKGNKESSKGNMMISKQIIDQVLCYYTTCIDIRNKIQQTNNQPFMISNPQSILSIFTHLIQSNIKNYITSQKVFNTDNHSIMNYGDNDSKFIFGNNDSQMTFSLIQDLQKFIVKYFLDRYQLKLSLRNSSELTLRQLIKIITQKNQQSVISDVQIGFIKQLHYKLISFIQSHIITLMKNQSAQFIQNNLTSINEPIQSINYPTQQLPNLNSQNIYTTIIPLLNLQIPTYIKQNLSHELYSLLHAKLSSYNINYNKYLPLIYSNPLQIQHLTTTISSKDTHIHKLNQQIAILQIQLQQKDSTIQSQQHKITQYKQDEIFYQQLLNQLNSTQQKLYQSIQNSQKLTIDLQCSNITNIQSNQTIETYKLKQTRLLQQKQNFLEAISHLSKENQHYITLSQHLQSTVDSLNHKIHHYKLIDIQINSLILQNHQLKQENQSIKLWKSTLQQSHKSLIQKQIHKFNHVLKLNFNNFQQLQTQVQQMKQIINELTDKLESETKNSGLLQEQINYIKSKYFHSNYLTIDYPHSLNQQDLNSHSLIGSVPLHSNHYPFTVSNM